MLGSVADGSFRESESLYALYSQAERKQLQEALRDFEVTAQARREAERRVKDLETSIKAIKDRAQQMVQDLTAQRCVP